MRLPLCPRGIRQGDGAGFIVLLTLLFYLLRRGETVDADEGQAWLHPPRGYPWKRSRLAAALYVRTCFPSQCGYHFLHYD